jgi:membrane-bound lytic murein transglycosylase B
MDSDGHRDIWHSVPDALGSIANYLKVHDWDAMKRWGYEVRLPAGFDFAAITAHEGQPVGSWEKLGIVSASGQPIAERGAAWLYLPAGARGPAFLTLQNFWAIKTYNISDSYTLSVSLLADRLRGGPPLAGVWPAGETALARADLEAMQRRLVALGHAVDKIDGKVGPSTRAALRAWQVSQRLTPDGYPTPDVLRRMGIGH